MASGAAPETLGIDGDHAKANGKQRFVAKPGRFTECLFRPRENCDDIVFR